MEIESEGLSYLGASPIPSINFKWVSQESCDLRSDSWSSAGDEGVVFKGVHAQSCPEVKKEENSGNM